MTTTLKNRPVPHETTVTAKALERLRPIYNFYNLSVVNMRF
jgi:hypothetical protein